jgi:hypothetical protein
VVENWLHLGTGPGKIPLPPYGMAACPIGLTTFLVGMGSFRSIRKHEKKEETEMEKAKIEVFILVVTCIMSSKGP